MMYRALGTAWKKTTTQVHISTSRQPKLPCSLCVCTSLASLAPAVRVRACVPPRPPSPSLPSPPCPDPHPPCPPRPDLVLLPALTLTCPCSVCVCVSLASFALAVRLHCPLPCLGPLPPTSTTFIRGTVGCECVSMLSVCVCVCLTIAKLP